MTTAAPSATRIAAVTPIAMVVRFPPRIAWEDAVVDADGWRTNTGTIVVLSVEVLVVLSVGVPVMLSDGWRISTGTTVVLPVGALVMLSVGVLVMLSVE